MYKLSDFEKGQTAYLELVNNAARGKKNTPGELIRECTVESVGRKYVTAAGRKFEVFPGSSYIGLKEHSDYAPDYILYPNKEAILDLIEKRNLIAEIRTLFQCFVSNQTDSLTLDQLRRIKGIIEEGAECRSITHRLNTLRGFEAGACKSLID